MLSRGVERRKEKKRHRTAGKEERTAADLRNKSVFAIKKKEVGPRPLSRERGEKKRLFLYRNVFEKKRGRSLLFKGAQKGFRGE